MKKSHSFTEYSQEYLNIKDFVEMLKISKGYYLLKKDNPNCLEGTYHYFSFYQIAFSLIDKIMDYLEIYNKQDKTSFLEKNNLEDINKIANSLKHDNEAINPTLNLETNEESRSVDILTSTGKYKFTTNSFQVLEKHYILLNELFLKLENKSK
ncbi:MAG: hypothetical protein VXZ40_04350 [Nanoarchaeota archaeon]|nr:hypothetical protein [Nanoarchaeota archaeon]